MNPQERVSESRLLGSYLRQIRESRRLSLDAVEAMASGYPERITKSHLSRIENGLAEPSFRRLFALSRIYGVPVTSLAERYEIALMRERSAPAAGFETLEESEILERAAVHRKAGQLSEALDLYDALLDRRALSRTLEDTRSHVHLRLNRINCLTQMAHYAVAKDESERVLDISGLDADQRLQAYLYFAISCYRTGKYSVAMLALDQTEEFTEQVESPGRTVADLVATHGAILAALEQNDRAVERFETALKLYRKLALPYEECRIRRNVASLLIETSQFPRARNLLRAVIRQAEEHGYERHRAYAYSDLAALAWKEGDPDATERWCIRSNTVARSQDCHSLVFRNCFYLWKVAQFHNDITGIKRNEKTLRSYLGRVDETMPETMEFRSFGSGGAS